MLSGHLVAATRHWPVRGFTGSYTGGPAPPPTPNPPVASSATSDMILRFATIAGRILATDRGPSAPSRPGNAQLRRLLADAGVDRVPLVHSYLSTAANGASTNSPPTAVRHRTMAPHPHSPHHKPPEPDHATQPSQAEWLRGACPTKAALRGRRGSKVTGGRRPSRSDAKRPDFEGRPRTQRRPTTIPRTPFGNALGTPVLRRAYRPGRPVVARLSHAVGGEQAGSASRPARQVWQKFARKIFFLGDIYNAEAAHRMGMVNAVVPHAELEARELEWARKVKRQKPDSAADAEVVLRCSMLGAVAVAFGVSWAREG